MPVIYRTAGAWGAGKGSNLTPSEVDGNFFELLSRVATLEDTPLGSTIDYFAIIGASLYVHLTDHTVLGPYALPVASWRFRDVWLPATEYLTQDVITYGGKVYLVTFDHVSAGSFDPGANDGDAHDYYALLLSNPDPVAEIALSYSDRVRAGGAVLDQYAIARTLVMPINLPESQAYLRVAPETNDVSLLLFHNSTQIGTVDFSISLAPDIDGGLAGTFTFDTAITFNAGDRFSIVEDFGTEDTAALGLSITIIATAS